MMTARASALTALLTGLSLGCSPGTAAAPKPAAQTTQAAPQTATQAGQTTAPQRPTSTPYAGDLTIFDYPDRDKKLEIDRVMTLLGIQHGSAVADLGAGSGWFTVRAAKRVGPAGSVYAEDINPAATKYVDDRAAKEGLTNVHTVLDQPGSFKLPGRSVDAALILKTYHEFAHPVETMRSLVPALKDGAKVGIIDRNGNGSGTDHGIPQATVEREMDEAGFRKVAMYDFTRKDGQDYFLIFQLK